MDNDVFLEYDEMLSFSKYVDRRFNVNPTNQWGGAN